MAHCLFYYQAIFISCLILWLFVYLSLHWFISFSHILVPQVLSSSHLSACYCSPLLLLLSGLSPSLMLTRTPCLLMWIIHGLGRENKIHGLGLFSLLASWDPHARSVWPAAERNIEQPSIAAPLLAGHPCISANTWKFLCMLCVHEGETWMQTKLHDPMWGYDTVLSFPE